MTPTEVTKDETLVAGVLSGDRSAFAQIVERYQSLLCSLAYSATGDLTASEDVAQDAFVTAWQQMSRLREPEKLRSWLCAIVRNKIGHHHRTERNEPVGNAEPLESVAPLSSGEAQVFEQAMAKEEQSLLWQTLERLPLLYREPLVLYYREQQSIEHVAVALDLTEDAVKQRLARGRKMLQEQILNFVEGALRRTTPGRLFTLTVLASLPSLSPPAKAAAVGTAALQGGALAKSTGLAAFLASASGVITSLLILRASLDQSRTERERRAAVKTTLCFLGFALGVLGGLYGLREAAYQWPEYRKETATISHAAVLLLVSAWPFLLVSTLRQNRKLRSEERCARPERFEHAAHRIGAAAGSYCSSFQIAGIPLVKIRFSAPDEGEKPVFAWIAAGDRAVGLLLAWGACAIAPISIGSMSVGLISIGAVSVGVISLGTFAVGFIATGAAAIGYHAASWLSSLGWQSALSSGFATAHAQALGAIAFAAHANDDLAHQLFLPEAHRQQAYTWIFLTLVGLIPLLCYAAAIRKRLATEKTTSLRPH